MFIMDVKEVSLLNFGIFAVLQCITGQTLNDAKNLQKDLFNDYQKGVRPVLNQSEPLYIDAAFYLMSINSMKEVEESISITAVIGLIWTDPSLSWEPSVYGNISLTIIDPIEIWIPPVFVINSVDVIEPVGHDIKFYTKIWSTGKVQYLPGGIMNAKCPTDIAKFPFDTQTCEIRIGPWGITKQFLIFNALTEKALMEYFIPNSDWSLIDHKVSVPDFNVYSMLHLTLTIKREPLYYCLMVIVPTMVFALLNPLVFLLPVESGERVSLSVTILLSYAIFLTLASSSIPATSNPMCALLIVMMVIIVVSGTIVLGSIVSTHFYYQDDGLNNGKIIYCLISLRQKIDQKVEPIGDQKEKMVTGKDMSRLLDNLFIYGAYLAIIITIVSFFCYVNL